MNLALGLQGMGPCAYRVEVVIDLRQVHQDFRKAHRAPGGTKLGAQPSHFFGEHACLGCRHGLCLYRTQSGATTGT